MATATKTVRHTQEVKEYTFLWTGKNKAGKIIRGEQRATSETVVNATLRRQGILVTKVAKQKFKGGAQSLREGCCPVYPAIGHHDEIRRSLAANLRYRRAWP